MRAIFTAGGTAGHINPALAIAGEIMRRDPSSEIVFIGRKDGMERKLVTEGGYRLFEVEVHGFMRRVSFENLVFNAKSFRAAFAAQKEAKRIIADFEPDIVVGCGGYVSGPVVRAASMLSLPTAIHEQNAFPGVTTRLLAKRVSLILCSNADSAARIGYPKKTVVTGNPVRSAFFDAAREKIREKWDVGDKVFVLSTGGTNGASGVNSIAAAFMAKHQRTNRVFHVHSTGAYSMETFQRFAREYNVDERCGNIKICEYIDDMPEHFAAADLIISRAGGLAISEIAASGRASVLIPSPNVTENHQFYNAMSLVNAGAALVFQEKDIEPESFADRLMALVNEPKSLQAMGEKAKQTAAPDAAHRIYNCLLDLLDGA